MERLKKLHRLQSPELVGLAAVMKKRAFAGYQEQLLLSLEQAFKRRRRGRRLIAELLFYAYKFLELASGCFRQSKPKLPACYKGSKVFGVDVGKRS